MRYQINDDSINQNSYYQYRGCHVRGTRIVEVMTRDPVTIDADALAVEAARLMETRKINALLVIDDSRRVVGALNIHDLLRARVV